MKKDEIIWVDKKEWDEIKNKLKDIERQGEGPPYITIFAFFLGAAIILGITLIITWAAK